MKAKAYRQPATCTKEMALDLGKKVLDLFRSCETLGIDPIDAVLVYVFAPRDGWIQWSQRDAEAVRGMPTRATIPRRLRRLEQELGIGGMALDHPAACRKPCVHGQSQSNRCPQCRAIRQKGCYEQMKKDTDRYAAFLAKRRSSYHRNKK